VWKKGVKREGVDSNAVDSNTNHWMRKDLARLKSTAGGKDLKKQKKEIRGKQSRAVGETGTWNK